MPLRLSEELQGGIDELPMELRAAAEAIGLALQQQLSSLKPALTRVDDQSADVELVELDLDHEGAPDAVTLAACVAAHRSYVNGRGTPEATSAGALAIGRLLVWAQRAAMLGATPQVAWIGPEARCPEPAPGQHRLGARCMLRVGGAVRRASAASVISQSGA